VGTPRRLRRQELTVPVGLWKDACHGHKRRCAAGSAGIDGSALGDQRAQEGVVAGEADLVEVSGDVPVGGWEAGLGVRKALGCAVGGHQGRDPAQVGSGDRWEQVVLDLVVQAAHQDRDDASARDVAAHQHLTAKEVQLERRRDEGHPDVVGRERAPEVHPEDGHLDDEEEGRLARGQDHEDERTEATQPDGQEPGLDPAAGDGGAGGDPADALPVQGEAFQQGEREEVPALMRHEPAQDRGARAPNRLRGERDRPRRDVGVSTVLVRVGVVAVVLGAPPAVADADEQVRQDQADPVVPRGRLEHLPVGRVVAEEGDLGHDHGQHDAHAQLPPAVPDPDEPRNPCRDGAHCPDEHRPVVAVPASHQSQPLRLPGEGGEGTRAGSGRQPLPASW